jgi:serine/threonine-protein phosphatase 5
VHLKCENFGLALSDSSAAIELNPQNTKAYYRRGMAYFALTKFSLASKDFRQSIILSPTNYAARSRFEECKKNIKRLKFEAAICSKNIRASEMLNMDDFLVDESYDGPYLDHDAKITESFIQSMLFQFKNGKQIHKRFVVQILLWVKKIFEELPNICEVSIPKGATFTICGDIHGQFFDLCNIFEINGKPTNDNIYLFNGDFVDRGSFSCEVVLTLFAYKCLLPKHFHLLRGNHETNAMNALYGFQGELTQKYGKNFTPIFNEVFCALPLGCVLSERIFIMHGGLFSDSEITIQRLNAIDRFKEPSDDGVFCEILWSDPCDSCGKFPNKRGVGIAFGPDITKNFLRTNGLKLVIRSHEVKDQGYEIQHSNTLITVFSAPNYCDQMGNKGAFIRLKNDMIPEFITFDAVPHPDIPAMFYANPYTKIL